MRTKTKYISFILIFTYIFLFSCIFPRDFAGTVSICGNNNIGGDSLKYSIKIEDKKRNMKSFGVKEGNFFIIKKLKPRYFRKNRVKGLISLEPSENYKSIEQDLDFEFTRKQNHKKKKYKHPIDLEPPLIFNGKILCYEQETKINRVDLYLENTSSVVTTYTPYFTFFIPKCRNSFKMNIKFAETEKYKALDTTISHNITNNNIINLKPYPKKLDLLDSLKEVTDLTLRNAELNLQRLEKYLKDLENSNTEEHKREKLRKYIEDRKSIVLALKRDYYKYQSKIRDLKDRVKKDDLDASDISYINDIATESNLSNLLSTSETYLNDVSAVKSEVMGGFKYSFAGLTTFPSGSPIITGKGKRKLEDFYEEFRNNKNEKHKHIPDNKLYIAIEIECSADKQTISSRRFASQYNNSLSNFSNLHPSSLFDKNVDGSYDPGNRILAFLRGYNLLQEIKNEFPNYNYDVKIDNYGSSQARNKLSNPRLRYSEYSVTIYTERVAKSLGYKK